MQTFGINMEIVKKVDIERKISHREILMRIPQFSTADLLELAEREEIMSPFHKEIFEKQFCCAGEPVQFVEYAASEIYRADYEYQRQIEGVHDEI